MLLQRQWGRGAAGFWFLSEVGSPLCTPAGGAGLRVWGRAACHPAHPTDLSHLRAQRGGGEEHGAGLCAVGRGVLLGPLCVGQRALVLLSSEARMWLPVPDLCQALMKPPEVGTVKAPVTAEPLCVSSGRQWHRLPACSLPQTSGCAAPCHSLSTP